MSDKTVGRMQGWECAVCMSVDTYESMLDKIFGTQLNEAWMLTLHTLPVTICSTALCEPTLSVCYHCTCVNCGENK